jgi:integrase
LSKKAKSSKRNRKGDGSIYLTKSGKYRASIWLQNGTRKTKVFQTKKEAVVWIKNLQHQLDQGLDSKAFQLTFQEYLDYWKDTFLDKLRPNTQADYKRCIQNYIIPQLGTYRISDLSPMLINSFYANLAKDGISDRLRLYIHQVLHKTCEDGIKLGLFYRNPTKGASRPKYNHQEMQIFDEEQVQLFLIASQNSRYHTLYEIAVKYGIREGELFGLQWDDIDWDKGTLSIRRQVQRVAGEGLVFSPPKTRAGRRTIHLGTTTLLSLKSQQEYVAMQKRSMGENWKENNLIFPSTIGTPIEQSNLLKDFYKILQSAGLPNIRFHDLRHTAASIMLTFAPVIDVSRILGHSLPSTTLNIYGHLIPNGQPVIANKMDEILTPIEVEIPKDVSKQVFSNSNKHT